MTSKSQNFPIFYPLQDSSGLPPEIINLSKALYTDTLSCVRVDVYDSEGFSVLSGVRKRCVVAPDLFLNPMDWLVERTVHRGMVGTSISSESFSDLDFANDVALLAEMLSLLVLALETRSWMRSATTRSHHQLVKDQDSDNA